MGFYCDGILKYSFYFLVVFLSSCSNIPENEESLEIETCAIISGDDIPLNTIPNLKYKKTKTYRRTLDSIVWCKIKLNKTLLKKNLFLIGSDAHFLKGQAFVFSKNSKIQFLTSFSNNEKDFFEHIFYKYPAWRLPSNLKMTDVIFVKINGHKLRNRLDFFIENDRQFFKRMQLEYFWTGAFVFFLLVLILIILFYGILLREYSFILYILYVGFVIVDFLSFKGIGKQYLWGNIGYLTTNRTYTFCIAFSLLAIFFDLFYNPNKKHYKFYLVFRRILPSIGFSLFVLSLVSYYFNLIINVNFWCFHFLKYCSISFLVGHIYLIIKKQIPYYLAIGFSVHLLLLYIYQAAIPFVDSGSNLFQRFLFLNMSYLSYAVEILFVVYYIFSRFNEVKKRYQRLKRRNAHLLFNMNNQYLEARLKEREELLDKIHNSFGGAIEALKYKLSKEPSIENIKKPVDSFYFTYRRLIQDLNTPNLNSFNLKIKVQEYLDDNFNEFPIVINSRINFNNRLLSDEIAYFVYFTIIELVTNVIKHAMASKLDVEVKLDDSILRIEVIDDGVGFNQIKNKKFGLASIRDKTNDMDGSFAILKPKKGTHITIQIPLK